MKSFGPDVSQLAPTSESTILPETSFRIGSDYYLSNRGCFRYRASVLQECAHAHRAVKMNASDGLKLSPISSTRN